MSSSVRLVTEKFKKLWNDRQMQKYCDFLAFVSLAAFFLCTYSQTSSSWIEICRNKSIVIRYASILRSCWEPVVKDYTLLSWKERSPRNSNRFAYDKGRSDAVALIFGTEFPSTNSLRLCVRSLLSLLSRFSTQEPITQSLKGEPSILFPKPIFLSDGRVVDSTFGAVASFNDPPTRAILISAFQGQPSDSLSKMSQKRSLQLWVQVKYARETLRFSAVSYPTAYQSQIATAIDEWCPKRITTQEGSGRWRACEERGWTRS